MKGHFYKPHCKCPKDERCKCGAKWAFILDVGIDPATGKRRQKKKSGFKTKADAQKYAARITLEIENRQYITESNVRFSEYSDQFMDYYDDGTIKPSTVKLRRSELNRLNKKIGGVKLKDANPKLLQKTIDDLAKEYSRNTMKNVIALLRMLFKKAVADGLIKNDPASIVKLKRKMATVEEVEEQSDIPKYLEKDQLVKFLEVAKENDLEGEYVIFLTLAHTGMRIGELLALKISDVDFDTKEISITKTYYNMGSIADYEILSPKTISSKRTIAVDESVLIHIKNHIQKVRKAKMRHRKQWHDKDFLFCHLDRFPGYPYMHRHINKWMERYLQKIGIQRMTVHSLRHTHTSLLAEAGVGLVEIMDRLGHTNDSITRSVYLHVTADKKKEAPQKLVELLQGN